MLKKKLEQLLADLPKKRRASIETRAGNLATLKDLRLAAEQTQQDLAVTLGVGQDAISRLEKRDDMLLSTLRRYVEAMDHACRAFFLSAMCEAALVKCKKGPVRYWINAYNVHIQST